MFYRFLFVLSFLVATNFCDAKAEDGLGCCKEEILQRLIYDFEFNNNQKLKTLYSHNDYKTLWDIQNIEQLIISLADKNLNYCDKPYHTKELKSMLSKLKTTDLTNMQRSRLDLLASDTFLSFSKDLYEGEIDWNRFEEILKLEEDKNLVWERNPQKRDYVIDLKRALHNHSIGYVLQSYIPKERGYKWLIKAYHKYKDLKFPKIDYLKDMKIGDYGYDVVQLKKFLLVSGDLKNDNPSYLSFPNFDEELKRAVLSFQKRHYLKQTGVFDKVNAYYARVGAKEKLKKIALNIERYKLFPRIKSDIYIVINIPGFWLKFFQNDELVKDIFVVVGREDRPTPIFKDFLEYIVLNPTWSIPQNLMKKDYIPQLVKDPNSLEKDDIVIYKNGKIIDPHSIDWSIYLDYDGNLPFQMVQKAGEKNVLGEMKFIFPNRYHVYLHDTDAKNLTIRRYRLFSSGCIRLSDPYALLGLLAPYTGYDISTLVKMIDKGKTMKIKLRKRIPIHIRYLSVFVDEEGRVNFRKDFYGYDAIQMDLLNRF